VRLSDFRGRRNLVVLLLSAEEGASSRRLLTDLAERYAEFVEEDAEILSVIRGPVDRAAWIRQRDNLPFPVLADEDGRVHRALGGHAAEGAGGAAVYVADRYGEVFYAHQAAEGQSLPTPEEILGWVRFIELQCPE
jgi:peroxiredoxin